MKSESERAHQQTIRQQIIELLRDSVMSVREMSQEISLPEKEIYEHLNHIHRSISVHGGKLIVAPYQCADCGYVFLDRKKLTKPGRCPKCKKSHIQPAMYHIE